MKVKIANNRKKQGCLDVNPAPIGALEKYRQSQNSPNYHVKQHKPTPSAAPEPPKEAEITDDSPIEPEIITPNKIPYKMRHTKRCSNCGELISKTDPFCWCCKMPTNPRYNGGGNFNQTIVIKDRRRGGCVSFMIGLILFIILLPFILYLIGAISLVALFDLF